MAQGYSLTSSYSAPSQTTLYGQAQLDQLLAPIALYPDPLVAQILMAATYPLDVAEAGRWLQNGYNASLRGNQLDAELQYQKWAPSVKALISFPDIVRMMDSNLQWTEQLGEAFLGQQAQVMDEVQSLRHQAYAAGVLRSTPQQYVVLQDGLISIEPVSPEIIYVPVYNPSVVYGTWRHPDYPPYYFTPSYIYRRSVIDFGVGVVLFKNLFFVHRFDFRNHRIDIDDDRYKHLNEGRPPINSGVWKHEPSRRSDIPVFTAAHPLVRGISNNNRNQTPHNNRPYRGYTTDEPTETLQIQPQAIVAPTPEKANESLPTTERVRQVEPRQPESQRSHPVINENPQLQNRQSYSAPQTRREQSLPRQPRMETPIQEQIRPAFKASSPSPVAPQQVQRPTMPIFESQTTSPDVRAQSQRGSVSRANIEQQQKVPRDHRAERQHGGSGGRGHNDRDNSADKDNR